MSSQITLLAKRANSKRKLQLNDGNKKNLILFCGAPVTTKRGK